MSAMFNYRSCAGSRYFLYILSISRLISADNGFDSSSALRFSRNCAVDVAPITVEWTKSRSRTNLRDNSVNDMPLSMAKARYANKHSRKFLSLNRDIYPGNKLKREFFGAASSKYFPVNAPPAKGEYAKSKTLCFEHVSFKSVSNAMRCSKLYPF